MDQPSTWQNIGDFDSELWKTQVVPLILKDLMISQIFLNFPQCGQLQRFFCIYISITRGNSDFTNLPGCKSFTSCFTPANHPLQAPQITPGFSSPNASEAGPLESGPFAFWRTRLSL
jgi:hypothetical protein